MKVLITGASGLLGKSLIETSPDDITITATYKKNGFACDETDGVQWYQLDISNRLDVFELMEIIKPDIVIHCAAIGSVDYAHNHYQEVFEINVTGTMNVVEAANGFKAKFVYVSSNAVFSGKKPPYNEKSILEPVNAYGVIKKHAERSVKDTSHKWLILRPFLLYGWPFIGGRTNWPKNIVETLSNGGSFKLVNDHVWMPTYAPDCATAIWQLLEYDNQVFNVSAPERATLYELGLKVCDVFGFNQNLIQPVRSGFFLNMTDRPHDTTYDLVKLSEADIMLDDIRTGLEKMKEAQRVKVAD